MKVNHRSSGFHQTCTWSALCWGFSSIKKAKLRSLKIMTSSPGNYMGYYGLFPVLYYPSTIKKHYWNSFKPLSARWTLSPRGKQDISHAATFKDNTRSYSVEMVQCRRREAPLTVYSPFELISLVFSTSRGWHKKVAQPPCRSDSTSRRKLHAPLAGVRHRAHKTRRLILTAMKLERKCVNTLSPITPVPRTSCLAWS